jgi:hypothetical protein
MLRKMLVTLVLMVTCGAVFVTPARAQSQTVTFNLGYFWVQGSRPADDVLFAEINGGYYDQLFFNVHDFNGLTVGADWQTKLGNFLEAGVGFSYYSKTVTSVSANFTNSDGSEITQSLHLRITPIIATVRFLPLGRHAAVEPYIGGGVGFFNWRYSETGSFVFPPDTADGPVPIVSGSYSSSGWATGPVIVGGVRVPVGAFAVVGSEVRYQWASGNLSSDFLANKISLNGTTFQATFGLRF